MKALNHQREKGNLPVAKTQSLDGNDLTPVKPRSQSASRQRGVVPSAELVPMQFKMPREFVKAFKLAAVSHEMKLNELLKACFDAFNKDGKKGSKH